ncbi:MAG TPA: hypothetical protein VF168_05275 [Trueperaceae bacterium]
MEEVSRYLAVETPPRAARDVDALERPRRVSEELTGIEYGLED